MKFEVIDFIPEEGIQYEDSLGNITVRAVITVKVTKWYIFKETYSLPVYSHKRHHKWFELDSGKQIESASLLRLKNAYYAKTASRVVINGNK